MPFFVSPDGVRLHYEIEGSGPVLVMHVGAGCRADVWREAGHVAPLSQSFQCVLFDHRGHGASDHPSSVEANHVDRYEEDLTALVGHLGHSGAAFFGWSNGFQVGLRAADMHPSVFDSLILFGGIPRSEPRRSSRR